MNGDRLALVGILMVVPAVLYVGIYFVLRRRALAAVAVTALACAAASAFIASAVSAMASAVDPTEAVLRGGAIGLIGGSAIAGLTAGLLRLLRL